MPMMNVASIKSGVRATAVPWTHHGQQQLKARYTKYRVYAADEDKMKALQDAMNNPELMKTVEERMRQPEVQQEMQSMQAMMSNPEFMARAASLREDPDLKPMFDEIKTGGMAAMMKYMNDPTFLAKIGEKLGDVPMTGEQQEQPAAAAAAPPEINTILDAARYGDVEAIEDFVAIGKADMTDDLGRNALHYAVAYDQGAAAGALLENGIDVNAADSKGNTALHFAAGYGRSSAVKALITVGAQVSAKNNDGQTAADLIKAEPRNPLNQMEEIMKELQSS